MEVDAHDHVGLGHRGHVRETLFYGTPLLKLIAAGDMGPDGRRCRVLRVPIDFAEDSLEPEWLAAACLTIKGHYDEDL